MKKTAEIEPVNTKQEVNGPWERMLWPGTIMRAKANLERANRVFEEQTAAIPQRFVGDISKLLSDLDNELRLLEKEFDNASDERAKEIRKRVGEIGKTTENISTAVDNIYKGTRSLDSLTRTRQQDKRS